MTLRRFFPCYGHKWSMSRLLPAPRFDTIVEPFAGGAGYSCQYGADRQVRLYDADPVIVLLANASDGRRSCGWRRRSRA